MFNIFPSVIHQLKVANVLPKNLLRIEKIMKTVRKHYFRHCLSVCLIFMLVVMNGYVKSAWADSSVTATPELKKDADAPSAEKKENAPEPEKTSSGNTLLYAGIGVGAAVAIAAAAGSGGGDSSDSDTSSTAATTTTTPTTTKTTTTTTKKVKVTTPKDTNPEGAEPVGADIAGSDWSGFIDLVGSERQSITATISQNGTYVVIRTTSSREYGKKFVGNIASDGFMKLYDQSTGEIWTTHYGNATANKIDIYDYVNNYQDLDQILLQR